MNSPAWMWASFTLVAVLVIVIWSLRRQKAPKLSIDCQSEIVDALPSLSGLTFGTLHVGNDVRLLENGAFYDVLVARISQARRSVHFETFLWKEGELSRRMVGVLCERAQAGVAVRIMLDAAGSRHMDRLHRDKLRAAGCALKFFHKRSIQNLGLLNDRDHRKICIVDGTEAFIGGHCITDEWLGDAEDGQHFADVSLHLHGPIVHSVQSAFSENWVGETGALFLGDDYFPPLPPAGDIAIHAAFAKPSNSAPAVKILHHTVLCLARKRIWIQNPYFIPEPEAIDAMGAAVSRGVDVRVLMPATSGSDSPFVQHAGHRNFEKLLKCGVRLFEYPHTLLHQKVMTVDGVWSCVGSTNFDDRSFETNDEISLGIHDEALAAQLDSIFERYVARAQEVELEKWRRRGIWHKLKDNMFYLVNELL